MNIKRIFLLSFFMSFLAASVFSQSKLQSAGKASKAGVSTSVKTSSRSTKPATTKKSSATSTQLRRSSGNGEKYASAGYMEILDISFANTDANSTIIDNYDSKLYAKEVRYLTPRMSYKGLASEEKKITLNIKLFDEDGNLKTGTSSPDGFTYSCNVKVETGDGKYMNLSGWGSPKEGSYSAGLYKMEVWYKNNMLYHKEFRLYSGVTPIVSSSMFSISGMAFANTDKDGNIISDYNQTLYDGQVQYLTPKMYYNGKYSNDQNITLYFRYFKSSGELICGSASPVGYSFKASATIKPGSNSVVLSGFGNEAATSYKEGTCKVEVWLDGEKLYETNVVVSKPDSSVYTGEASTAINDFFPIWGMTLGKTTWKDSENAGYEVRIWSSGPDRYADVHDVTFWDHEGLGRFTSIYWTYYESDFPDFWKSKGFSWNNSYDAWLSTFKNLGFSINVTKEPETNVYDGRKTLSADVQAVSEDGMLRFKLDFDYGKDGYYTSSSKTLYSITVDYLGN